MSAAADKPTRNLLDVVAEEFAKQYRSGEAPSIEEYAQRHPQLAAELRELLPSVELLERAKRKKVAEQRPERIGGYRILGEIGRGGMGIVYEAEEESLNRRVALKVLPSHFLYDSKRLERFQREARAAAHLHHTNIVPVFGTGESGGLHYLAMQFVSGMGLNEILNFLRTGQFTEGKTSAALPAGLPAAPITAGSGKQYWNWVARVGLQVAEALQYAHSQGILHRDIKPANILIDQQGTVWVADFGLAKMAEPSDLTMTGEILGTPQYMAPEMLESRADNRTDVCSLGLTLYELLALRQPFGNTNTPQLLRQIAEKEPLPLRQVNPAIPKDLETIVQKACSRDARHRYQTAGEFADDLRRYLSDLPVAARPVPPWEHFWRWARRNQALAALGATVAVLLLLTLATGWIGYVKTRDALRRESQRRQEADTATQRAEANMNLSLQALEEMLGQVQPADEQNSLSLPPPSPDAPDSPPRRKGAEESKETAAQMKSILKFYDRFTAENTANAQLQTVAAKAYLRIGEIQQLLGEFEQARAAYERELAISDALRRETSANPEYIWLSAQAHHRLGMVLRRTNQLKDTEAHFRQALALTEALARQDANSDAHLLEVSQMRFALGEFLFREGQPKEARKFVEQSLAEARSCQQPELRPRSEGQQAVQYSCLAEILASLGEQHLAEEARRKAEQLGKPPPPPPRERQAPLPPPD